MDTGEMGIDLGVGQLGSYADIQERLTQLERPEPVVEKAPEKPKICLLYTSPSPRD